ncbi:PH domain-containing protein [Spongiactinospora sp. TRM90649]|uniref:PH domain-containing protein n=1 Tax=Spongiactinospora sp. TRM90649 TaxID=3031114 RepID=UPI0023F9E1B4|nr:PH domain-containing protein [Spongiactinospora sp. TRM90649]MDF5754242.1 PH domain-containing protein [Spongiactinospora sp. TRM90649]
MAFRPRRSLGWAWLLMFAVVSGGVSAGLAAGGWRLWALAALLAGFGLLYAAAFPAMRYVVADGVLTMSYGPLLRCHLPLSEIRSVTRADLRPAARPSFRLPGLALYRAAYADTGTVLMCATSAGRGVLLLRTRDGDLFGITPADETGVAVALGQVVRGRR